MRCRRALAERDHALHRLAADDEIAERQRPLGPLLDAADLSRQRLDLHGAVDRHFEPLGRGRLDDEVDGAEAHRVDRRVDRAVRGLHDDRRDRLALQPLEHRHAVDAGHDEIEEDERDRAAIGPFEHFESLLSGVRGFGFEAEALDGLFEDAALGRIIVNDENTLCHVALRTQQQLGQDRAPGRVELSRYRTARDRPLTSRPRLPDNSKQAVAGKPSLSLFSLAFLAAMPALEIGASAEHIGLGFPHKRSEHCTMPMSRAAFCTASAGTAMSLAPKVAQPPLRAS